MVKFGPASAEHTHRRVRAFLCGTFVLALGLVLVHDQFDGDGDDDQAVVLTAPGASESTPAVGTHAGKALKVAKAHKLRPKKNTLKKRGKRVFFLNESVPPIQASQRPRRGCQTPHLALPDLTATGSIPDLSFARLSAGTEHPLPRSPQLRQQPARGPPSVVLV